MVNCNTETVSPDYDTSDRLYFEPLIDNLDGQIFALYILVVAAAESAIGLSILIAFYRVRGTISVKFINLLKG